MPSLESQLVKRAKSTTVYRSAVQYGSHVWLLKLNKIKYSVPQEHKPQFKCRIATCGPWHSCWTTKIIDHFLHHRMFYWVMLVYRNESTKPLLHNDRPGVHDSEPDSQRKTTGKRKILQKCFYEKHFKLYVIELNLCGVRLKASSELGPESPKVPSANALHKEYTNIY